MNATSHSLLTLLLTLLLLSASPVLQADDGAESYGSKVGYKALNGFANMTTSVLEIPKNIINTTNQSHILYGISGGLAKGLLNTLGRTVSGLTDFITAPLPTQQFVQPAYVWDDFDADTTYGQVFRLQQKGKGADPEK